jgi:hypothetical protein
MFQKFSSIQNGVRIFILKLKKYRDFVCNQITMIDKAEFVVVLLKQALQLHK